MRRPNIVLIVVDDLGWADLGCYGSTFHDTPRLDELAAEGMFFIDAYAAAPVCSPTRASLLTGRYPASVGVTQFIGGEAVGDLCDVPYLHSLPLNEHSLARALRDGGYRTWHVGKWHLGGPRTWPEQHGFEVNLGGCDWGMPRSYTSPYDCPTLSDGPDGEHLTDRLTDEAIHLITHAGDEPFFLNLWHYAVHIPIVAPEHLEADYRAKAARLGLADEQAIEPGELMPPWHLSDQLVERRRFQSDPAYAAMVHHLDSNVGRLLDALEATGHAEDTLVVFTSDNGGLSTAEGSPTSNEPLAEGKGWLADGGLRVPMLVRWPGQVAAGSRTDEPVSSPDVYPTLLAAAGLEPRPEQQVEGRDLTPLLRGEPFAGGPVFWHYPHYSNQGGAPAAAVRDGVHKLIHHFTDGRDELFRLDRDPGEQHDLAAEDPSTTARLARLLARWSTQVHALIPRPNPHSRPEELTAPGPGQR